MSYQICFSKPLLVIKYLPFSTTLQASLRLKMSLEVHLDWNAHMLVAVLMLLNLKVSMQHFLIAQTQSKFVEANAF
jgi:hypothetical protein